MSTYRVELPWRFRARLGLFYPWFLKYGPAIPYGFRRRKVLLTSPEDIRHVLTVRAENYVKSEHLLSRQGLQRVGQGLIASTGERHHALRRLLWPVYKPQAVLDHFGQWVVDNVSCKIDSWLGQFRVDDLFAQCAELTAGILRGVLFGRDVADPNGSLLRAMQARRRYNEYYYTSLLPWHLRWPLPVVRNHPGAVATIDRVIAAQFSQPPSGAPSLMSFFREARFPDGTALTEREVRDELFPLTTTGFETTGEALAWMLLQVARHPEVAETLRAEVKGQLGGRIPQPYEVGRCIYAEMVVSETLRLYPPTWTYVRVPLAADRLPSGLGLQPSDLIFLCPYLMHRHPAYFPDPTRFSPQRFAPQVDRRPLQFVYFPFGVGAHRCIGENLARLELLLALVLIIQRCHLTPYDQRSVPPHPGLTLGAARRVGMQFESRRL